MQGCRFGQTPLNPKADKIRESANKFSFEIGASNGGYSVERDRTGAGIGEQIAWLINKR
jgi:hypothetical protein